MSDVLKSFKNSFEFAGVLVSLDRDKIREGTDKNNNNYLSFHMTMRCSENGGLTRDIEFYSSEKTRKGSISKAYTSAKKWLETCVSLEEVENKEDATKFFASGTFGDNSYINSHDEFKYGTRFTANFIGEFKEYLCDLNIETYINSIKEEVIDEKETGRMIMSTLSFDYHKHPMKFDNIIIEADIIDDIKSCGYDEDGGVVGMLYLSYINRENSTPKSGGFGKKRTTDGKSVIELVIVGAEDAVEIADDGGSDKVVDTEMVRIMRSEAKTYYAEIKEKGYLGSSKGDNKTSSSSSQSKSSTSSSTSRRHKPERVEDEDDDMPF